MADGYDKALEAITWARRVGVDRIVGYLEGGMAAWSMAGFETKSIKLLSVKDLHRMKIAAGNCC